ncbi:MAG: MBL fold metallo-hydrolase [Marinobacterium sp.]|nr:MBL fold metallo-hydrolase [Marinobacterium sp.]
MAVLERIKHQDLEGLRTGHMNLAVNTSFVVFRLGDTLIDAGPRNQWRHIRRFIDERAVRQLLLTHFHEDHSGCAARIAQHLQLAPRAGEKTGFIMRHGFQIQPYRKLMWRSAEKVITRPFPDEIIISGRDQVLPVATPGHTPDLHCFLLPERGWLCTADLYLSSRLKLLAREEDLHGILRSMETLLRHDFDTLLCAHRGVVTHGKQALQTRYENICQLVEATHHLQHQGCSVSEIRNRLLGREPAMSFITGFHFSKRNLIEACLRIPQQRTQQAA